jgi:hypothetical protein
MASQGSGRVSGKGSHGHPEEDVIRHRSVWVGWLSLTEKPFRPSGTCLPSRSLLYGCCRATT